MKHIKKYEHTIEDEHIQLPQIGDYVICTDKHIASIDKNFDEFLKNNIGKIIKTPSHNKTSYDVKYRLIPNNVIIYFTNNIRSFYPKEILHHSPNKEDLELYVQANKYNI